MSWFSAVPSPLRIFGFIRPFAGAIGASIRHSSRRSTLERAAAIALTIATATAQGGWQLRTPSPKPPGRGSYGLAYDVVAAKTVMFGGWDWQPPVGATYVLGDTWLWDGTTWTNAAPATAPTPRAMHAMAYDVARNRVVL